MFQIIDVSTGVPVSGELYSSAAEASCAAANLHPGVKTRIKLLVDNSWMVREASRFEDGSYKELPIYIRVYTKVEHYAHVSTKSPEKIAFTESPEKGMVDAHTVLSASTYLARYAAEHLLPHEIRDIAAQYESRLAVNPGTLVISHDRAAFRFAYNEQPVKSESSDHVSCMARAARSYTGGMNLHPAEAYATDQDGLAIAYTTDPNNANSVTARAVLWPQRKIYVRVYGLTDQYRIGLTALLKERGYTRSATLEGAPIARIPAEHGVDADDTDGTFLMPYIDGDGKTVDDSPERKRFFVCDCGDYAADETSGTIEVGRGGRCSCENCGDRIREDDSQYTVNGYDTWCESCYENEAFTCERTGEAYSNSSEDAVTVHRRVRRLHNGVGDLWRTWDEVWSESAAQRDAFHCQRTDAWYCDDDYTPVEVHVNTRAGSETWCVEATEDDYFLCPDCEEYFANDMAHPDTVGTAQLRCHDCYEEHLAHQQERGYPVPTYTTDANQLELTLVRE